MIQHIANCVAKAEFEELLLCNAADWEVFYEPFLPTGETDGSAHGSLSDGGDASPGDEDSIGARITCEQDG